VGTQHAREGSDKPQPDIGALHRQIQELLEERDRSSQKEEEYPRKIADQQTTMAQLQKDI